MTNPPDEHRLLERFLWLSLATALATVTLKAAAAVITNSVGMWSDALESTVNLLAAGIALWALRVSARPADHNHDFGHGKAEYLSAAVEGTLIIVAAAAIIWSAAQRLLNPVPLESVGLGIVLATIASALNVVTGLLLIRAGKRYRSITLEADGRHLMTDVWTSVGVLGGLVVIWIGKFVLPGVDLSWVDPACAIAVALLIIHAAWELTTQATRGLLDEALPEEEIQFIRQSAIDRGDIRSLHDLKTRKAGPERIIDAHVAVDWDLTVLDGHNLGKSFKRTLLDHWEHCTINIHVDACDGACGAPCKSGCLLSETERETRHRTWKAKRAEG